MEKAAIGTAQAGLAAVQVDLAEDSEVSEEAFPEAAAHLEDGDLHKKCRERFQTVPLG